MAVIKAILGGLGVKFTDAAGNSRFMLKTPADKPFECEDTLAAHFVELGVAEYAEPEHVYAEAIIIPDNAQEVAEAKKAGATIGHIDPKELESMTIEQLKNLADDMSIDVAGCKKKADYVAAIAAIEVVVPEDAIVDGEDDLPDLSAADPE